MQGGMVQGGGLGAAVGMALAERTLAARFGRSLVDHRTWVLAAGADLSHGLSHEAASLAGQLRLDRLAVLWDQDAASGEGLPAEDTLRRFGAYGWTTRGVDAADPAALAAALGLAMRARKPTLLAYRGAPAGIPGRIPARPPWSASTAAALEAWRRIGARGATARRGWLKRLAHHPRRVEFERVTAGRLPATLPETLAQVREALAQGCEAVATAAASDRMLEALLPALPELVGGTADPRRAAAGELAAGEAAAGEVAVGGVGGRWVQVGAREAGLAAALDGMAAHGGLLPVGATACALGEALRPALWRAARLGLREIHVLTCDPPDAARRPEALAAEQLASLRAVPNLLLLHPADALETAECWEIALRREAGPSLLVVSREARPLLQPGQHAAGAPNRSARGGYVLAEAQGERQAALIAVGAAVAVAMAARARLAAERITVAVVSLPCWSLFADADPAWRAEVLGPAVRFGIEPGAGFGWERWLGDGGVFIGDGPDGSGPTADAVVERVRARLAA